MWRSGAAAKFMAWNPTREGWRATREAAPHEVRDSLRRLQEVDGAARRRRVDDQAVVLPLLVKLVQSLQGGVLVAAHEGVADALVEAVVEDPLGDVTVGA